VGKPGPSHMIYIVMYVLPVIYRTFTVPVLPEMVRGLGVMAPYVPPRFRRCSRKSRRCCRR
jgi:hypothetical protein